VLKRKKKEGTSMGHHTKLKNVKMANEKEEVAAHEKNDLKLVVTSPHFYIFSNLSFCKSELQNCHYG